MALQMVRSFFGQGTPSRSRVHEPVIGSEYFGNQEGNSSYDRGDVGKSAASNWFELARHPTSELGRKPHTYTEPLASADPGGAPGAFRCSKLHKFGQLVTEVIGIVAINVKFFG